MNLNFKKINQKSNVFQLDEIILCYKKEKKENSVGNND